MEMRSLRNIIRPHLSHKQANPHKRMPEGYYRTFWLPKHIYEDIQLIATIEGKSLRQTGISMLELVIKDYFSKMTEQEYLSRMYARTGVIPYQRPSPYLKAVRKKLEEKGVPNTRIDKGYRAL